MKLKLLFLLTIGVLPKDTFAQVLPWPQDPYGVDYRADSDYGPRNLGNQPGTFFHKGIDFNGRNVSSSGDINYPIFASTYGTIFGIGKAKNGLKWIGIDYGNGRSFGYLHLFADESPDPEGNFVGVLPGAPIQSYKRIYTDSVRDANLGVFLFYSQPNNRGRIIKALAIQGIHSLPIKVAATCTAQVTENCDSQDVPAGISTVSTFTVVVSAGDGILETMPQGDDKYSEDGYSIVAGSNTKADSTAGYVVIQTSVVPNEIIAPLGKSGYQTDAHLHLQISSPDDPVLFNEKNPSDFKYNDG